MPQVERSVVLVPFGFVEVSVEPPRRTFDVAQCTCERRLRFAANQRKFGSALVIMAVSNGVEPGFRLIDKLVMAIVATNKLGPPFGGCSARQAVGRKRGAKEAAKIDESDTRGRCDLESQVGGRRAERTQIPVLTDSSDWDRLLQTCLYIGGGRNPAWGPQMWPASRSYTAALDKIVHS